MQALLTKSSLITSTLEIKLCASLAAEVTIDHYEMVV